MIVDAFFLRELEELRTPAGGTELVGPMLYALTRMLRPSSVLEVGAGYTTPFLALALTENLRDAASERAGVYRKAGDLLDVEMGSMPDGGASWVLEAPALAWPAFYARPHEPLLVSIDALTSDVSSAGAVRGVLERLDLMDRTLLVNDEIPAAFARIPSAALPFGLVWLDVPACLEFLEEHIHLSDPAGGIVVLHYLLTSAEGAAVVDYIKALQASRSGQLEVISLVEPHKLAQNGVTMIRRTTRYREVDRMAPDNVMRSAEELLEGNP